MHPTFLATLVLHPLLLVHFLNTVRPQVLVGKYLTEDTGVVTALRLLQYDHLLFQQAERQAYYSRRMLAQQYPDKFTSMIVDGMQQATTQVPRKMVYANEVKRFEQKLVGVLVHGSHW